MNNNDWFSIFKLGRRKVDLSEIYAKCKTCINVQSTSSSAYYLPTTGGHPTHMRKKIAIILELQTSSDDFL